MTFSRKTKLLLILFAVWSPERDDKSSQMLVNSVKVVILYRNNTCQLKKVFPNVNKRLSSYRYQWLYLQRLMVLSLLNIPSNKLPSCRHYSIFSSANLVLAFCLHPEDFHFYLLFVAFHALLGFCELHLPTQYFFFLQFFVSTSRNRRSRS